MTPHEPGTTPTIRRAVWVATVLAAVAVVALVRVPTYLGVKVVEASSGRSAVLTRSDFRGSEYLWRVWWRARGEFVDVNPGWLLGAALLVGLVVFLVGVLGAYRLALSLPSTPARDV